jgi:hypothetical protein
MRKVDLDTILDADVNVTELTLYSSSTNSESYVVRWTYVPNMPGNMGHEGSTFLDDHLGRLLKGCASFYTSTIETHVYSKLTDALAQPGSLPPELSFSSAYGKSGEHLRRFREIVYMSRSDKCVMDNCGQEAELGIASVNSWRNLHGQYSSSSSWAYNWHNWN